MTTPGSMTMATGTNADQIALRDINQTTGRRWIHNATETISLFVSGTKAKIKDTFKIIAAKGNIQMQAQNGEIEATAQKDLTITSVNGKVLIQAPNEILLTAGGGYIRIGANIDTHNPGKQSQKAAGFELSGPASMTPTLPQFPDDLTNPLKKKMRFSLGSLPSHTDHFASEPYKLYADGALLKKGLASEDGTVLWDHKEGVKQYKIELLTGQVFDVIALDQTGFSSPEQQLANQGWRGFEHRSAIKAEHGAEGDDFRNLLAQGKNKDA